MPLYLTRIEGPPPKRNVVRSSRARGANCSLGERESLPREHIIFCVSCVAVNLQSAVLAVKYINAVDEGI